MKHLLRLAFLVIICAVANLAVAQEHVDELKVNGQIFKNVTVTGVTDTHLQFMHSRGSGSVKLKDLSPELQKRFGYDAAKSAAAEKAQQAADAQARAEAMSKKTPPKADTQRVDDSDDLVVANISAKSFRGQRPPKFEAEAWLTNPPNTSGKFVLIDFWATWCGPCRASIPHLNQLQAKFKDDLVVIGLTDEPLSVVKKMTSPKFGYAVAIDTQGRMQGAAQVRGIPHAMLMDPSGIVRFEGHPNYLNEQVLAKLLKKYGN